MSAQRLSDRALCVVAGLVKSRRVAPMVPGSANTARGFLRLDRAAGGFFWLALDGGQLRRGHGDPAEAEPLSPGFVEVMARLGTPRSGVEVAASPPQSALARVCWRRQKNPPVGAISGTVLLLVTAESIPAG